MKSLYKLSAWEDETTTVLWTPTKTVNIYGNWRDKPAGDELKMWESLPNEIREALFGIDRERSIEGSAWLPSTIELTFSPYENAPEESIIWPDEWLEGARKEWDDSFTLVLPSGKWPEIRRFLATQKDKGAVLVDGQKMYVDIRLPFPGEESWGR